MGWSPPDAGGPVEGGFVGGRACVAQGVVPRDDLRRFDELIASWPVQAVFLQPYVAVACLAYSRVVRDFDDGPAAGAPGSSWSHV